MTWSRDGKKIVVAGGDNCVHVIDPIQGNEVWKGKDANSSPRAYRAIFCGEYIVSVGFARSIPSYLTNSKGFFEANLSLRPTERNSYTENHTGHVPRSIDASLRRRH